MRVTTKYSVLNNVPYITSLSPTYLNIVKVYSRKYLLYAKYVVCGISFVSTGDPEKVEGVVGGDVDVPCSVFPNDANDKVNLILWYKDHNEVPIFRWVRVPMS